MWTLRAGAADALGAGTFQNCQLDLAITGRYGTPGIVPSPNFTGLGVLSPTDPHFTYSGTWASGATSVPGSSVSVGYVGYGMEVTFQTGPHGGIGFVTLDGSPRLAVDTYSASSGQIVYTVLSPSQGAHSLGATYNGDINGAAVPFTAPANGVGTSVTPNVSLVRLYRGQTTAGSHTIQALTSGTVSIDGAGSYATGTTVSGVIPGVSVVLGSAAMTVGDTSTFTTYATGVTIVSAQAATTETPGASYTTGIVDCTGQIYPVVTSFTGGGATSPLFFTLEGTTSVSSDAAGPAPVALPLMDPEADREPVQWVLMYWEEDPRFPVQTGLVKVGNNLTPTDPSWWQTAASTVFSPANLAITHDSLSTGDAHGYLGMAAMPRARFCTVRLDIPAGGFLRNPRFLCWNPDNDGERDRFPPLPGDDLSSRYLAGHIAAACLDLRDPYQEALLSLAYGTAVGKGLDARLAEWQIVRPYGMTDAQGSALTRLLSVSRASGCTIDFINRALLLVLGPNVPFTARTVKTTTQQWILGVSSLGVDTYLSPVTVGQFQAVLEIATDALTVPPQVVESLINLFLTTGVSLTYIWS